MTGNYYLTEAERAVQRATGMLTALRQQLADADEDDEGYKHGLDDGHPMTDRPDAPTTGRPWFGEDDDRIYCEGHAAPVAFLIAAERAYREDVGDAEWEEWLEYYGVPNPDGVEHVYWRPDPALGLTWEDDLADVPGEWTTEPRENSRPYTRYCATSDIPAPTGRPTLAEARAQVLLHVNKYDDNDLAAAFLEYDKQRDIAAWTNRASGRIRLRRCGRSVDHQTSAHTEREAGRCLDAEVAEKVMGWSVTDGSTLGYTYLRDGKGERWFTPYTDAHGDRRCRMIPLFSASITDAWRVVEKLVADGCTFALSHDESGWSAAFGHIRWGTSDATAATPAHAICLAALGPR